MKPMHPIRRLRKIIRELEQSIRDASYWNSINPDEQPVDFEPERVMLAKARACLAAWRAGDRKLWTRLSDELAAYANSLDTD